MTAEVNGRTADRVRELCHQIVARRVESPLEPLAVLILAEFPPVERLTAGLTPFVELCHAPSDHSSLNRCDRVRGHGGLCTWEAPLVPPF